MQIGQRVTLKRARNHLVRDAVGNFTDETRPIPVGTKLTVVRKESHGSNPWTRWTCTGRIADGTAVIVPGCCEGSDI